MDDLSLVEEVGNHQGLSDSEKDALKSYARKFLSSRRALLLDGNHLAWRIGISAKHLHRMAFGTSSFYRSFKIAKKTGGYRTIFAPLPSLRSVQRWILDNALIDLKLHESCVGFREDYSIKNNATAHLNKEIILKLDLENFFTTITLQRVIGIFRSLNYLPSISFLLARLCTLEGHLPQGAPTSPTLSNLAASRLDCRLSKLCKSHDLTYTRYADDITISGTDVNKFTLSIVTKIVASENFVVNKKKTTFLRSCNGRRFVTGINVSNGRLTVPREFKRILRKEVYFVANYGLDSHQAHTKVIDVDLLSSLSARVGFLEFIEGESSFSKNAKSALKTLRNSK